MWAFDMNASTGRPFPWALAGDTEDPRGAGIDVDPHDLAFLHELEAIGAVSAVVFEAQVVMPAHLRDHPALDLAHRQVAPSLHLLARARLVAARLRGGGNGNRPREEGGGYNEGEQLAHGGCLTRRKALNKE